MSVGSSITEGGFIGLSRESVGIDRRIYTNRNDTNPTLPVSYNAGRVEVYLNGIRLVGNHTEMGSTYDYTFTSTGSGSSIQLQTGIQLALTDVIECIGYVSNAANTVTTYNPSVSAGDNTFTGINHSSSDLLNVYLNGVLLDSSDYTASPGTASSNPNTVTITALALNDVVAIQVIQALAHNDFVPASGGTFSGNVSFGDNNITNVGDIAVDTISSDAGTSIGVTLGTDDGDNFNVGSGKLVVEGDTGRVGVGNDAPDHELVIGASGSPMPSGDIGNTIEMRGSAGDSTLQRFQITNSGEHGKVELKLGRAGSSPSTFISVGPTDVTLNQGNLVIGTAGKGINFSAYATSGNPSSNLLDDYEEGTWTPHLKTASNGTATTSYQTGSGETYGRYQKVGNVCHAQFKLYINVIGNANQAKLHGLPFNSANLNTVQTGACSFFSSLATAQAWLAWYIENNTNTAYFVGTSDSSSGTTGYAASTYVNNGPNVFTSNTIIYGAISYFTE